MITHGGRDDFEGQRVGAVLLPDEVRRVLLERQKQNLGPVAVDALDGPPVAGVLQLEQDARGAHQILRTEDEA